MLLLLLAGDIQPNPGHTAKYPCPVCAQDVTSRGVSYLCTGCSGWVHTKCSGILNAAQYRRNKDWACDPCSVSKTQQSTPPQPSPSPTPAPRSKWRLYRSQSSRHNPRTLASVITPQYVRTVLMATVMDYLSSFINRYPSPNSHRHQRRYLIPTWKNLP